jgi:pimeloyl-ACP methyl ester carboxylesterase
VDALFPFPHSGEFVRTLLAGCLLPLLTGCWGACYRADAARAVPSVPNPVGVVFVANGSGDFRTVSRNLSQVVAETAAPLQIETCAWSHGYLRYAFDHIDHSNQLEHGSHLAAQIAAYRQACRGRRIYLIGHSAGCAVVLAAAELLPPDSIDRIILLAPSVCTTYDLRPALRTARSGMDVFHSSRDRFILGLCMKLVGTADRSCRTAAGQVGFTPILSCPADAALYGKLRQHPWDPAVEWSGHHGGHYGNNEAAFLQAYVLPLLLCN